MTWISPAAVDLLLTQDGPRISIKAPGPGIAKPECWQQMNGGRLGPRLTTSRRIKMSSGFSLGVLHKDIEVAILGKRAGIQHLILIIGFAAPLVFGN